jgi:hypothetical protein
MKIYKNIKAVYRLFFVIFALHISMSAIDTSSDQIDSMVDFAYPISDMQLARNDLSQAVYALQQNDIDLVAAMLQNALIKIVSRKSFDDRKAIDDDDREYIQDMINQINAIIDQLEHNDKAIVIAELSAQLQESL